MSDEMAESAKAVQEVAKATRTGIEATERLGGFVARMINEPVEAVTGMVADKLRFVRWERQLRLYDRSQEIIRDRGIEGEFRVVPPKLALPIVENASLEEDDELQDLWANLLASAVDPRFGGTIRSAYIEVIKQLETIDVHVLNMIYEERIRENDPEKDAFANFFSQTLVDSGRITGKLGIEFDDYVNSADNLLHLRCISSNVSYQRLDRRPEGELVNARDYDLVCLTSFGLKFVEACIVQPAGSL